MHAIWQGYVEDPAAKDFVARKACTIAWVKRKEAVIRHATINLFTSLDIPWWFHTRAVLCSLARPRSRKKVSVEGFLWERKVLFVFSSTDVCTRNLRQKAEKGNFTSSEATTRFPRASCFEKTTRSVPETWGCIYNILAWSANGTRNGTRNRIPMQLRKARRNQWLATLRKVLEKESSN
jgi:hypothetical protein